MAVTKLVAAVFVFAASAALQQTKPGNLGLRFLR